MIRLFVSDIDGCLATPFQPIDLDGWKKLSGYVREAGSSDRPLPRITVCSGRPLPYVEAVAQALDLQMPALFESGGGSFYLPHGRVTWNPRFTDELADHMEEIRHWLVSECIPGTRLDLDYSKRTQAGVIGPDSPAIDRLYPIVQEYVQERFSGLRVFCTSISIDVVPDSITKRQALDWLADVTDIPLEEMAFIGDTGGDLEALEAVGMSFAPQNAVPEVKEAVSYVTAGAQIDAVLEAVERCAAGNGVQL